MPAQSILSLIVKIYIIISYIIPIAVLGAIGWRPGQKFATAYLIPGCVAFAIINTPIAAHSKATYHPELLLSHIAQFIYTSIAGPGFMVLHDFVAESHGRIQKWEEGAIFVVLVVSLGFVWMSVLLACSPKYSRGLGFVTNFMLKAVDILPETPAPPQDAPIPPPQERTPIPTREPHSTPISSVVFARQAQDSQTLPDRGPPSHSHLTDMDPHGHLHFCPLDHGRSPSLHLSLPDHP